MAENNKHTVAKEQAKPKAKQWSMAQTVLFILFIFGIMIPYIQSSHKADNRVRKVEKLKKEIKDLRAEFITLKSEIVGQNKQTDVAEKLAESGIKIPSTAPFRIKKSE